MATKKPYSRHTNSADRRKYEGTPVPSIQPIVKPDHNKGTTVTVIQPVSQPPTSDKRPAGTQSSPHSQHPSSNQPSTDKPKPETSGQVSSK